MCVCVHECVLVCSSMHKYAYDYVTIIILENMTVERESDRERHGKSWKIIKAGHYIEPVQAWSSQKTYKSQKQEQCILSGNSCTTESGQVGRVTEHKGDSNGWEPLKMFNILS